MLLLFVVQAMRLDLAQSKRSEYWKQNSRQSNRIKIKEKYKTNQTKPRDEKWREKETHRRAKHACTNAKSHKKNRPIESGFVASKSESLLACPYSSFYHKNDKTENTYSHRQWNNAPFCIPARNWESKSKSRDFRWTKGNNKIKIQNKKE